MKSNSSNNTNDFFKKHFHEAKCIRAICDDLHFPKEYSPVFVNIHIRGTQHFLCPPLPKQYYSMISKFLDPESDVELTDILPYVHKDFINEKLANFNIKDKVKEWDELLAKTNTKPHYFSDQIKMVEQLYSNEDFLNHMIALYTFFVKPLIKEYDEDKIQKAFYKGIIRDINEEINDYNQKQEPDA